MIASKDADQYPVRFPPGLRDRVKEAARNSGRSMNTEIVMILERALSGASAATGDSFAGDAPAAASDKTALPGGPIHHRS